jgi:hypothetical protein
MFGWKKKKKKSEFGRKARKKLRGQEALRSVEELCRKKNEQGNDQAWVL